MLLTVCVCLTLSCLHKYLTAFSAHILTDKLDAVVVLRKRSRLRSEDENENDDEEVEKGESGYIFTDRLSSKHETESGPVKKRVRYDLMLTMHGSMIHSWMDCSVLLV